jgi:hypothetical protein
VPDHACSYVKVTTVELPALISTRSKPFKLQEEDRSCFEFSLCLSRACLGKATVFMFKSEERTKTVFLT